ncbi:MAG: arginine--tRNA ligase [Candidatus Eremiobacteraeota bacterium]|nr:arginine--tRNA ligase [Candidatus Eremiobacteraeota bacterium]
MNPITTEAGAPMLPERALASFATALTEAVGVLYPEAPAASVEFEAPRRPEFGDFSTNAALRLSKTARRSPQDVAASLVAHLAAQHPSLRAHFADISATAGFINVRLSPETWQAAIADMLRAGARFGEKPSNGKRVSLEFGSANPTGPLVVVQGRTCSVGETLADAMRFCGYDVFVEWIINDSGAQLERLGHSLSARYRQVFEPAYPFPEDGYPGEYLLPIAQRVADHDGDRWTDAPEPERIAHVAKVGRDALVAQQQETVARFGVRFDLWQSEQELHDAGKVKAGLAHLTAAGWTYEQDGAIFFKATQFGDDKDRVLVRRDGRPTYLCTDVAYHYEKLQRSDRVIDILGPDHHGYIGRLQGLAEALGYKGRLDVLIAQQITLMRGTEQVSMSKRGGNIVTLDDILDEVGVDATRFFFVMLAPESPLTFDLVLAKEQSNDNPVYYVQYGHARIASVFKNASPDDVADARAGRALTALRHPAELALARRLAEFPGVVQNVVDHLAPHRLARYARDVAADFHQFYAECKILAVDRDERLARLSLCMAAETVLARVLRLLGVSAPDSM